MLPVALAYHAIADKVSPKSAFGLAGMAGEACVHSAQVSYPEALIGFSEKALEWKYLARNPADRCRDPSICSVVFLFFSCGLSHDVDQGPALFEVFCRNVETAASAPLSDYSMATPPGQPGNLLGPYESS